MVRRLLGIARLPDVATVSRTLAGMDSRSVDKSAPTQQATGSATP